MDIYFSTVFRYAPIDQAGELVRLDWDTKHVISKVPVAPRSLQFEDPNPRGNSRGGKGIAATTGILLNLFPVPTLIGILVFIVVVLLTKMVSLGSLVFVISMAVYALISGQPAALAAVAVGLAVFAVVRHRANIQRILAGVENKISY